MECGSREDRDQRRERGRLRHDGHHGAAGPEGGESPGQGGHPHHPHDQRLLLWGSGEHDSRGEADQGECGYQYTDWKQFNKMFVLNREWSCSGNTLPRTSRPSGLIHFSFLPRLLTS